MSSNLNAGAYTLGGGITASSQFVNAIIASVAPTTYDAEYELGQIWIDKVGNASYQLISFSTTTGIKLANWTSLGGGTTSVATITGDSGGALSPTSGNINILGTSNQVTTTGSGSTLTLSLPSTVSVTTSVTSGSFITSSATLGTTYTTNTVTPTGSSTNIDLQVNGKGTGGVIHSRSAAGVDITIESTNSDNTSGTSRGGFEAAVGGASAGDPYAQFAVSGVTTVTMGLDNSVSGDPLVISASAALGTSNMMSMTTAGAMTTSAGITATTGNIAASAGSVTAATTLTATLGNITATNGSLVLGTAGNGITIPQGSNATCGIGVLINGVDTVTTSASGGGSLIFVTRRTKLSSTAVGTLQALPGTGTFVVTSLNPTDASTQTNDGSTYAWWILNPGAV